MNLMIHPDITNHVAFPSKNPYGSHNERIVAEFYWNVVMCVTLAVAGFCCYVFVDHFISLQNRRMMNKMVILRRIEAKKIAEIRAQIRAKKALAAKSQPPTVPLPPIPETSETDSHQALIDQISIVTQPSTVHSMSVSEVDETDYLDLNEIASLKSEMVNSKILETATGAMKDGNNIEYAEIHVSHPEHIFEPRPECIFEPRPLQMLPEANPRETRVLISYGPYVIGSSMTPGPGMEPNPIVPSPLNKLPVAELSAPLQYENVVHPPVPQNALPTTPDEYKMSDEEIGKGGHKSA
ncbi:hypothetical protein L596_000362 [Steinernema carpocapsae]|uniref:Uncharacterized protein n=1 Tax=Steinernema carpocapsae TaxID=34508 RepID=A0A4U8UI48_STECR|nr:hypothetical protein L596_000362 [Steinernema carpocapsae]